MIACMSRFSTQIIRWQEQHGRHDLPWQGTRDAYRIWLAEIMLQQTQVAAVIPYYTRFLTRFPDIPSLARASEDEVMPYWAGLGYYARARNLHKAANIIALQHGGKFPQDIDAIHALPGIGRSTAAAVAAFAFNKRFAILDGNVKRVFARHFGIEGDVKSKIIENDLWALAESLLPKSAIDTYTQGLMDLGATLCTRSEPACPRCPVKKTCVALAEERISALPGRGEKNPIPHRTIQMLVCVASGEVLLERRPSKGIWGGLWSLPEVASADNALTAAKTQFGITGRVITKMETVAHGFTHYSLDIIPVRIAVAKRGKSAAMPGFVWINLADAQRAALPAPVKRILSSVARVKKS